MTNEVLYQHTSPEPSTVGLLRAALASLPADMPVRLSIPDEAGSRCVDVSYIVLAAGRDGEVQDSREVPGYECVIEVDFPAGGCRVPTTIRREDCRRGRDGGGEASMSPCPTSGPQSRTQEEVDVKLDHPEIVCLCGSTRFLGTFDAVNSRLTLDGKIVLSVGCVTTSDADLGVTDEQKVALDELHKRKIDLADWVYVLNVGGYIGSSTRSEIDYAIATHKPITYLEQGDNSPARARSVPDPRAEESVDD